MKRILLLAFIALSTLRLSAAREEISLDGTWRFQLDRADAGISARAGGRRAYCKWDIK